MTGDLVYVATLRGPAPERWPDDAPAGVTRGRVLARHRLGAEEMALPLAELERRYPAPAREQHHG